MITQSQTKVRFYGCASSNLTPTCRGIIHALFNKISKGNGHDFTLPERRALRELFQTLEVYQEYFE